MIQTFIESNVVMLPFYELWFENKENSNRILTG